MALRATRPRPPAPRWHSPSPGRSSRRCGQPRWGLWLDVPKEVRKHESVAYKPISGKRDTQLGINKGSPAFLLDDPDGESWCMKSASLIVDPSQTYDSLKDLVSRLNLPHGWNFRPVVLDQDLVLTPDNGAAKIT